MADFKFTDLTAGATGIDNDSLVCFSEYDGVSAYTSKKYTISTMRDILNVWEAEDKITFDSTGTNKVFVQGTNAGILLDQDADNDIYLTTNVTNQEEYLYLGNDSFSVFHADASGYGYENTIGKNTGVDFRGYDSTSGGGGRPIFFSKNNIGGAISSTSTDSYGAIIGSNGSTINSNITNSVVAGGVGITADKDDYLFSGKHEMQLATETVSIEDAGSTSATEQDWIEVSVGGVTGYIRVFATK